MSARFLSDGFFVNANVITMDPSHPTANAVLVHSGKVTAVGNEDELRKYVRQEPIVDCKAETLVPGFVDGHCHFEMATTVESSWVPVHTPPYDSLEDIANTIAQEDSRRASGDWLLCRSSFAMHEKVVEKRLFTRGELDVLCPNRPVGVFASLHVCSLNTQALKLLGLWDPNAVHPDAGVVHREVDGTPTGVVTEAFLLLPGTMSETEFKSAVTEKATNRWNAAGTTTVHTMPESVDQAKWELDMHRNRELSLRQRHYFIVPGVASLEDVLTLRDDYEDSNDMISFGGVKLFANGCGHDGYGREVNDIKFSQEELDDIVLSAHRNNVQVWIHSLNSEGVRMAALAIGRATQQTASGHRHRIEHGGDYIDPKDIELVRGSGALLVTTPQFIYSFSPLLSDRHAPLRTLIDAGLPVVGATDSTGTVPDSISTLRNVATAVSRQGRDGTFNGVEEAVTPIEGISMFTTWSSYGGFEDGEKGRIAPGFRADFTLLREDPTQVIPPTAIADITVDCTVLGGEVVFNGSSSATAPA